MTFDYTSIGFYTFDCLGRPVNAIPPGGDTFFIEEMTLAVSGAAGSAAIVAAKHGLSVQAVGGVGTDDMGDWVIQRLNRFGVDTENMARLDDFATSSSMVTTRPNGARPALHRKGATGGFYVSDAQLDRVLDSKILHIGGWPDGRHGQRRTRELMQEAKARGCTTTLDVFAATQKDFRLVEPLLPYTDYFMPSEEEAMALSGQPISSASAILLGQRPRPLCSPSAPKARCTVTRAVFRLKLPLTISRWSVPVAAGTALTQALPPGFTWVSLCKTACVWPRPHPPRMRWDWAHKRSSLPLRPPSNLWQKPLKSDRLRSYCYYRA